MVQCWKCNTIVSELSSKIGFRAQCQHCEADLHVCVGCQYFAPGKPNLCSIPGTEWIKDREAMNFCEDFSPRLASMGKEMPRNKGQKDFNALFKDDDDKT